MKALILFATLMSPAMAGTLIWSNPQVRCQIDGAVAVGPDGTIRGKCVGSTPPPPPPEPCAAPGGLIVRGSGPISDFNGEQLLIKRNEYYTVSFRAPAAIAYFGFSKIEQVTDADFFATISSCRGDFINVPRKCYATGRTFSLYGDTGKYSGCPLEMGKVYYLNVRTATPRLSAQGASAEKRSDDTCPPGALCGFTVRATLR